MNGTEAGRASRVKPEEVYQCRQQMSARSSQGVKRERDDHRYGR